MSEPLPQREWRFYIDDMIGFAEKVLAYTEGLDQKEFIELDYNRQRRHSAIGMISPEAFEARMIA